MARTSIISVFLFLLLCSGVQACTITVAWDGSGEFSILQYALDAAASGDSILVGPGEYTEMFPVKYPGYAWDVDVVENITVSELTIIGAGRGVIFIGQATPNIDTTHYSPRALGWQGGGQGCRVENVTLRNSFDGFQADDGPVFIDHWESSENVRGLAWKNIGNGG